MMRRKGEFWRIFLLGSPERLGAFFIGLLVVGLAADWLYDLLTAPPPGPASLRPLVVILLLTGLAYLLYWLDRRRSVRVDIDESRLAPPHAGLVWLLGPGPVDHLLFALEHHRKGGGATDCWVVMQDTARVRETYGHLTAELAERNLPTRLHPVYMDRLEAEAAYRAVRTVLEREAEEAGLTPDQIIADITGGTKPLTAGMVIAALTTGSDLEYVESERDAGGQPIPGTQRVVLVDMTFYLSRGE